MHPVLTQALASSRIEETRRLAEHRLRATGASRPRGAASLWRYFSRGKATDEQPPRRTGFGTRGAPTCVARRHGAPAGAGTARR